MTRSRQRYCSSRSPDVKPIDGTTARENGPCAVSARETGPRRVPRGVSSRRHVPGPARRGAPWRQLAPVEPAAAQRKTTARATASPLARARAGAPARAQPMQACPPMQPCSEHGSRRSSGSAGASTLSRRRRPPSQPSAVLQRWLDVEVSRRSFERRRGGRRVSSCRSQPHVDRRVRSEPPRARLRGFSRARYSLQVAPSGTRASVRGRRKGTTSQ